MARSLSTIATQSALSIGTGEVWLWLLTIDHTDLAAPFYLVNNTESVTHSTIEYIAYPFQITLAQDDGEHLPKVKLIIDNVDRTLVETIRTINDTPDINLKLVLASQPDTIELEISDLVLREVDYDAYQITGTLYSDDILNSRFPADNITLPAGYNGLFR